VQADNTYVQAEVIPSSNTVANLDFSAKNWAFGLGFAYRFK
jgi:hypothetical protein